MRKRTCKAVDSGRYTQFNYFKLRNVQDWLISFQKWIRTYIKSLGYTLKVPRKAHELTDIQKGKWKAVRNSLIMTGLKSFLLMILLLKEGVNV